MNWNSTPTRAHRTRGGTSCYVALCATLAGATFAASLESELSDSALLGYLRHRRFAATTQSWQISPTPPKSKNTEHPNGYSVFLAEKERFELSRR